MQVSAITPCPGTIEIDLPLDPETDCAEDVSRLVSRFLRDIDACSAKRAVSPFDVLQALCITTAVHAARTEARRQGQDVTGLPFIDARLSRSRQDQAAA